MYKRIAAGIPFLLVTALALAGCSGTADDSGGNGDVVVDGKFTAALEGDPGDLNPLLTNIVAAQVVGAYTYDSLVFIDPATNEMKPWLAESWTDGASEVTFTLTQGITCSDGTEFTAQTAADNFNWIADEANGSPLRGSVVPADAVATAAGNVLTVTTPQPSPFLLFTLGSQQLACDGAMSDPKSVSGASNGTGLFEITEVVPNDHVTLTRRDGYTWSPNGDTTSDTPGVPKTVTLQIITDPSTATNLLLSKGLNAAIVSGADEERLSQLDFQSSPNLSGEIIFNHLAGQPTADAEVRKALAQAVDLDTFTEIITGGKGERATSLLSTEPKVCVYDSVTGTVPEFDAKAASETLDEAGWAEGSDGTRAKDGEPLTVNLIYNNSTDVRSAAAEYAATQWESLGAVVNLDGGDESYVIGKTFATEDPSGWNVSIGLDLQSNTPNVFPPYFSGPSIPTGSNFASVDNADYVDLVAQAALESGDAACGLWKQAEQALLTQVDLIPVAVTPFKMYFSGAKSLYQPVAGVLPGSAIRVLN